ncbi:HD domain-containing protein [Haloferax sp. YSMS24]|uniref:HD domain-containing protein n=1 Tax=Haloferax sp. YSMS24 TaxID=3388425 RepID=UPI00398CD31D
MKTIKDSIHDYISVEGVAMDLMDTPRVQRLRRLKQLGTTFHVYPSANHTRFEHSLGVYHLSNKVIDQLNIEPELAETLRAAAMLHDIGHGPFSHNTEPIMKRETGKSHSDISDILSKGEIKETLDHHGISSSDVFALIKGEGRYGQLLASSLDIDRMDYLVRDAHHTGVPYGSIDHNRLIGQLSFSGSDLVLGENSIHVAQSLLTARALMYPTVYGHHATRISEMMVQRGTDKLIDLGEIVGEDLRHMDDYDLMVMLRDTEDTSQLAQRIDNRNLFKRAIWVPSGSVPKQVIEADYTKIREYEAEISSEAELEDEEVIVEVPEYPTESGASIPIKVDDSIQKMTEKSPLVSAIDQSILDQWRFGVYAPQDKIPQAREAAERILGLDIQESFIEDRDK